MTPDLTAALALALSTARLNRGLSAGALAKQSGVSRAMIGRIESGTAQPTAALLGRLSGALGMTLSDLIAQAEDDHGRLNRFSEQKTWTDPTTGYVRRALSRPSQARLELVEVLLPSGARVAYPASAYTFIEQVVWVINGDLRITEGDEVHDLTDGDSLRFGLPRDTTFHNTGDAACRYLVALDKARHV